MPWTQISLVCNKEDSDALADTMSECGAAAVTFKNADDTQLFELDLNEVRLWDHTCIVGLFDADFQADTLITALQQQASFNTVKPSLKVERLEDQDWQRACLSRLKPMLFGQRLWICPGELPLPDPDGIEVRIDPGMAFGTGTHATTGLCLTQLDSYDLDDKTVLDYGCGSGILAIAALKLGATSADATDIDARALVTTLENAQINHCHAHIHTTLAKDYNGKTHDIVIANILCNPLLSLIDVLRKHLKANGTLLLSGILAGQSDLITRAYEPLFGPATVYSQDGWVAIEFSQPIAL